MSYFAAACGSAIGMMIALVVFSNAWRFNLLPKDYDFFHEFGKALIKTDNRKLTYGVRMMVGILAHPVIFVFVWGKDGFLGINLLDSSVVSALILLVLESTFFGVGLYAGIPDIVPKKFITKVIMLQFMIHIILGILMGLFYDILPV
jgi:hypothetical protein